MKEKIITKEKEDILKLYIGNNLLYLFSDSCNFLNEIKTTREKLEKEMNVIIPLIRIQDKASLNNECEFLINGNRKEKFTVERDDNTSNYIINKIENILRNNIDEIK